MPIFKLALEKRQRVAPDELINIQMDNPICQVPILLKALASSFDAPLYAAAVEGVGHKDDVMIPMLLVESLDEVGAIGRAVIIHDHVREAHHAVELDPFHQQRQLVLEQRAGYQPGTCMSMGSLVVKPEQLDGHSYTFLYFILLLYFLQLKKPCDPRTPPS